MQIQSLTILYRGEKKWSKDCLWMFSFVSKFYIRHSVSTLPLDIQGWSYLLGQRFSACFVLKFALQMGEKGGHARFKMKYTESLTQEITPPCILYKMHLCRSFFNLLCCNFLQALFILKIYFHSHFDDMYFVAR